MRRPQFSLKTMLWLMALVGAFLAGLGWNRRQLLEERDAAQKQVSAFQRAIFALQKRVDTADGRLHQPDIEKDRPPTAGESAEDSPAKEVQPRSPSLIVK